MTDAEIEKLIEKTVAERLGILADEIRERYLKHGQEIRKTASALNAALARFNRELNPDETPPPARMQ